MKALAVFGTRPEAIKMAPVVKALKSSHLVTETRVCVTAQHRDMLDQVLSLFQIVPDWDLNLMTPGQDLADLTAKVVLGLRNVLREWRPDVVIVQGDTTTAFAAGLAAFYEKVDVAHVEAGLRTGSRYSPWPEEINRKLLTSLATYHFAPTAQARENLLREGVPDSAIWITGNTVIDSLLQVVSVLRKEPLRAGAAALPTVDSGRRIIAMTGHRRESFGEGFRAVARALLRIAERDDVEIIYPVHPNPHLNEVKEILNGKRNVHLIEPLDYLPFIALLERAYLVITDSGGVQEEAPSLGKPVLVTRSTTERPEAVAAGTVLLVGTDEDTIVSTTNRLLDEPALYAEMARAHNPYGDGAAAQRILRVLTDRA